MTTTPKETRIMAGKYLTFGLGNEEYGIDILKVQEIIRMQNITRVPRMPAYIRGVINLRGKIIPVIELRSRFGMDVVEDTKNTCIIVVKIQGTTQSIIMGIIIDAVKEVVNIEEDHVEQNLDFGASVNPEFLLGMGKVREKVVIMLDIDKVISEEEIKQAEEVL
jgi:purine-binding chemotaxis protein CheW